MLDLVGTVEHHCGEISAVLLHQMAGDLGPGPIARILQLNPGLMLALMQALHTFLFLGVVHAENAPIKVRDRADLIEELFGINRLP